MNENKLIIAKELIEILAMHPCTSVGSTVKDRDVMAVKRIIEAARRNYVLPSYCAEMNSRAGKCIECIIEHNPPTICREKNEQQDVEDLELDIEWEDAN